VNLTGALPDLSSNIEIKGPGADKLTVRRNTGGDYRIFHVTFSVVSISGITISNGNPVSAVEDFGGGIENAGGTLTITNSTISGNTAQFGGGISSNSGSVTVTNSTISGNTAEFDGGGIYNIFGPLTVTNSTISDNTACCSFGNGEGGGIFTGAFDVSGPKTTITSSTISGNTGRQGGGFFNDGGRTLIEFSTITHNTSYASFEPAAGGVQTLGLETFNSTEVFSSIISGNTKTDVEFGSTSNNFVSKGYNLIGDGNAIGDDDPTTDDNAFDQTGDQTNVADPKLGDLADNGGPTQTHALLPGSLAIDQGNSSEEVTTDQRGEPRPHDYANVANASGGDGSDSGAYELQTPSVAVDIKPTTCPNPLSAPASGTIPVAILGTSSFDVSKVNPTTVTLEGVSAQQGRGSGTIKDVATPYSGEITTTSPQANQCTAAGPEGKNDLNLKFDAKPLLAKLGAVTNKEVRVLTLTGKLNDGTSIWGQDVVVINKKK
jgi:hypothetical protein